MQSLSFWHAEIMQTRSRDLAWQAKKETLYIKPNLALWVLVRSQGQ